MHEVEALPPRQKEVLRQILVLTQSQGYPPTLAELAHALGLRNRMTVHQHVVALKRKGLVQWEPGLNRSLRVSDGLEEIRKPEKSAAKSSHSTKSNINKLPFVGTIAAGQPIDATETKEYLDIESPYAETGCFALKIKGDSMIEDGIYDGDFVIVKPNPSPKNGEIVVALLEDGCATLKRFYKEKGQFRLQPSNKDMAAIILEGGHEIQVQGTVVGLFRKM